MRNADGMGSGRPGPAVAMSVQDLRVTFNPPSGPVRAVRGVSFELHEGEILGVAGESGCGKSVLVRALLGLLPATATVEGTLGFDGESTALDGALQSEAALIYQNPGASLNPVFTIGQQLQFVSGSTDPSELSGFLLQAGLKDPEQLLGAYPHEFSGGMGQRAAIALALAQRPRLLFADEPTTALDVTTQSQVLELIAELRQRHRLSVVLISHDLAVIKRVCDRVMVLYAGLVAETGTTSQVLTSPSHPYTQALLESVPRPQAVGTSLASIPGMVPDGRHEILGCAFAPRCSHAHDACITEEPAMNHLVAGHSVRCVLSDPTR